MRSYLGIGDNIYQRPFIKKLAEEHDEIYIDTPVPQLYVDCGHNIKFVKSNILFKEMELRTQKRYMDSMPEVLWTPEPDSTVPQMRLAYHYQNSAGYTTRQGHSVIECLSQQVPGANLPGDFKIRVRERWILEAMEILQAHPHFYERSDKLLCVVKVPTIRAEWPVPSRNPKFEYYRILMDGIMRDYQVICLADLEEDLEWLDFNEGDLFPNDDLCFFNGEFNIRQLLGLMHLADLVICCPSFMVPMCAAVDTKTFCIFGGFMAPELILDDRMGLDNFAHIAPGTPCEYEDTGIKIGCFNPDCDCDKEIDTDQMAWRFEKLRTGVNMPRYFGRRRNLLLVRIIPEWMDKIAWNEHITELYDIHVITQQRDEIIDSKLFSTIHSANDDVKAIEYFLLTENIDTAIISQQLFHTSEKIAEACKNVKVPVIWTERFFDNKRIFDATGLQYMPDNEIKRYIDKVEYSGKPDLPQSTREPQADMLNKEDLYNKYRLDPDGKYIVMFGQTVFDMSLTNWICRRILTFREYADLLINTNKDVTFIYKNHPLYYGAYAHRKNKDVGFMNNHENVIEVIENIDTLFNAFDYFTSFSSTTVLEGLIQNKIFATAGYHFCNDPALVLQLKTTDMAVNLYDRMQSFQIDQDIRLIYLEFVCNYLCLDVGSEDLLKKIELDPDRFYKYMSEKQEG